MCEVSSVLLSYLSIRSLLFLAFDDSEKKSKGG